MHAGIEGLVLPMLNSAADVVAFDRRVAAAERASGLRVGQVRFVCLLETPAAILAAAEIARASLRTLALSFGHADFLHATRGDNSSESLLTARSTVVMAARAEGLRLPALFMDLANDRALPALVQKARASPAPIPCTRARTPSRPRPLLPRTLTSTVPA